MRDFSSAVAYRDLVDGACRDLLDLGYKRFTRGCKKVLSHAIFIFEFRKSRDTRADKLMVSLHAEILLTKLNPIFRSSSFDIGIPTVMPYDFAMHQSDMGCPSDVNKGYWTISNDHELRDAISNAQRIIPSGLEFFSKFFSEAKALEMLRLSFLGGCSVALSEAVKYPAYLALMGDDDGFRRAMDGVIGAYESGSSVELMAIKYKNIIEGFLV
jgi:hypothetical protein